MFRKHRVVSTVILLSLLLALPMNVLANKRIFKARLSTSNELHTVVGSTATGSFVLGTNPDGTMHFMLRVINLSGPATGAHIHAPADTTQTAGVKLTLCGGPAPAVTGACTTVDGVLFIEADIPANYLQPGVTPAMFVGWLDSGLAYVNVHTALNPGGETRGQIIPQ